MANAFYNNAWTGVANAKNSKVAMVTELNSIVSGFDAVELEVKDRSIRLDASETTSAFAVAASRVGKVATFGAAGAVGVTGLIDGTLFDAPSTHLMPVTFASNARSQANLTEITVPWDNGPTPDIGSSYAVNTSTLFGAKTLITPAKNGLYLVQYTADITPASAVSSSSPYSVRLLSGYQTPSRIEYQSTEMEAHSAGLADLLVTGETHNINVMVPVWYNSNTPEVAGIHVRILVTGATSGFNFTNERLTLLRLAAASGDI